MKGIFDEQFKRFLSDISIHSNSVDWSVVNQYFSMTSETRDRSYEESTEFLSFPISVSNLVIACNLSITFALTPSLPFLRGNDETLYSNKDEENLLPPTWLDNGGIPNPNLLLFQMFCQTSNLAQSIVHLCEVGQDHSARILLRSLDELCQLILIITRHRSDFRSYALNQGADYSKVSHTLFSKKRRFSKLSAIEMELGRNTSQISASNDARADRFSRFSESVHSAPLSIIVGSMVWSFRNDKGNFGLFGGCNKLSKGTLSYLIHMYDEFFRLFFGIIEDIHKLQYPENKVSYWNNSKAMSLLLHETFHKPTSPRN